MSVDTGHRPSMLDAPRASEPAPEASELFDPERAASGAPGRGTPAFKWDPLRVYRSAFRRFFTLWRHLLGLLYGGLIAYVNALPPEKRRGLHSPVKRTAALLVRPLVRRDMRRLPFPVQLRRRLEILGPTYIKLGQIMAIREDLLPRNVTEELANLLDRLPELPWSEVAGRIERSLGMPLEQAYAHVDPEPIGSASIAQVHRAALHDGTQVVVKVMKPGIRATITSDLKLLGLAGRFLQWVIPQYEPRQIVEEFGRYTLKEVDFRYEADHAETFAANFHDLPEVVFPRMYRELSTSDVLTMSFIDGFKPGAPATAGLDAEARAALIDVGAAAIVRMLYRDGFFHADLHAGNLRLLPGSEGEAPRVGFIDLGMVGRFEEKTRRRMLYYFHALTAGDVEGATRHLVAMARVAPKGDAAAFRRAVADLSRRFLIQVGRGDFSIAQLILESLSLGTRYRVSFPVEMILMVKALVTFEGVGRLLDPRLDIVSVTSRHVSKIFRQHFDPASLSRELMRSAPEMVDLVIQLPQLLAMGAKTAEEALQQQGRRDPLAGLRSAVFGGASVVGAALVFVQGGTPWFWAPLLVVGLALFLWGK